MNDFERIARVIRYLEKHHATQPTLGDMAKAAGLSESHFHRLFHRWAGITPKDFVQCLTAEHAKRRLRESASVLDAALDTGLSGPGRLHDLLVTIEAASPGEYKSGGQGLTITWGIAETPFGWSNLAWNVRGICHLSFQESAKISGVPAELRDNWPAATFVRDDQKARSQAEKIFNRPGKSGCGLKTFVRGTPFQLKVWRALLRIPEGGLASYGAIAALIGHPKATRAVGTACGANPVAYLIPCHRVIRETGVVRGYRWGTTRKQALLACEAAQCVMK